MEISVQFVLTTLAGFLPAMLISRLLLQSIRGLAPGASGAAVANGLTWVALGLAASHVPIGGEPLGVRAALFLAFPQFCCLAFDLLRPAAEACGRARAAAVPVGRRTLFRGAPMASAGHGGD
jgi:hypothetical protein